MPQLDALDCAYTFPDPRQVDPEGLGLIAVGGDLEPSTLIYAYRQGLFPWFNADEPLAWWCPEPRCVLRPNTFVPSKSLKKQAKKSRWSWTLNQDFEGVMMACSQPRAYADDTWINGHMVDAYLKLHQLGFAHSIEIWQDSDSSILVPSNDNTALQKQLIGGLYGIKLNRLFCGESMFHRQSNASKMAFWALTQLCQQTDVSLIDCQLPNDHLHSLGATDMPRDEFLDELKTLTTNVGQTWRTTPHHAISTLLDF